MKIRWDDPTKKGLKPFDKSKFLTKISDDKIIKGVIIRLLNSKEFNDLNWKDVCSYGRGGTWHSNTQYHTTNDYGIRIFHLLDYDNFLGANIIYSMSDIKKIHNNKNQVSLF